MEKEEGCLTSLRTKNLTEIKVVLKGGRYFLSVGKKGDSPLLYPFENVRSFLFHKRIFRSDSLEIKFKDGSKLETMKIRHKDEQNALRFLETVNGVRVSLKNKSGL